MARSDECYDLAVVIVNWNAGHLLQSCIKSILAHCARINITIVVVDNGSTDRSCEFLKNHPDVRLIRNKANLGFGVACNIGAQNLFADYFLFLNPDAEIFEGTLQNALVFMQDPVHSRVGICGVQLKDESGHIARSCARFPTAWRFLVHTVGLDRIWPSKGHFMADWPHDSTQKVDHVIGAFYLVRRNLFELLCGFDERFFVYLEDLDFSYRARLEGWESFYLADVQAFHAGGGTSRQVKARRLFYSVRSRLLYAAKHFSVVGAASVFVASLFIEPLSRTAMAMARRSWSALKETWQGYAMLWSWLPQWVFKGKTR